MMTSVYEEIESKTINNFNLRCIDGSIHGCGKCVGYCAYTGHAGFLTADMEVAHDCINKGCHYHHPKPATPKRKKEDGISVQRHILEEAKAATSGMEGLRILRTSLESPTCFIVHFAAIASYDTEPVEAMMAASTGYSIRFKQLSCDFETAASLVMGGEAVLKSRRA